MSGPGGVCSEGGVCSWGVYGIPVCTEADPPSCRQTDRCKNITFATSLWTVTRMHSSRMHMVHFSDSGVGPSYRNPLDRDPLGQRPLPRTETYFDRDRRNMESSRQTISDIIKTPVKALLCPKLCLRAVINGHGVSNICQALGLHVKQECIPVECVPSAAVAVSPGGGVCA